MKILFLSHYFSPRVGGVEKHVEKISKILISKGHEVSVLTEKYDRKLKDKENLDGIKIVRFSYPHKKYMGLFYIWYFLIQNSHLIKESDVIHIHDVFIWYLPLKIIYPNKKVYVTFHGWEGKYPIPYMSIFQKWLTGKLSSGSIGVGKYLSKYFFVYPAKVIYGAVDRLPDNISLKKKSKSIVYVGRLSKDTGLPVFLDIFKKIKDKYTIHFCGDGDLSGECSKYGVVHGFTNPRPYLAKSEFCLAGGYLTIIESLLFKCQAIAAWDNPLKRDCFQMAPFSKYIYISNSSESIASFISKSNLNSGKSRKNLNLGQKWAMTQTWEKLTSEYLNLWK